VPDGFSGNGREEFTAFWEPFLGHNIVLNVYLSREISKEQHFI